MTQSGDGAGGAGQDGEWRIGRSLLINDAARVMGVSRRTVYYRIRAGQLLTIRTRCGSQRVMRSSIEALMERSRELAGEANPAVAEEVAAGGQGDDGAVGCEGGGSDSDGGAAAQ